MSRADCTVRTLSAVAYIGYALAHDVARDGGRVTGRGVKSRKVIAAAKAKGMKFRKLRYAGHTVAKFIRDHPVGRFYCSKRGHAFAVIDGCISDGTALGSIINNVWEFSA